MSIITLFKKLFTPSPSTPVHTISVQQAHDLQKSQRALIVDVRTPAEFKETGVPKGAVKLPLQHPNFEQEIKNAVRNKFDRPVIFICRSGQRAQMAAGKAAKAGLTSLYSVRGGVPGPGGWVASGLPVDRA